MNSARTGMPLIGALSNHAERLVRLSELKRRLLKQAAQDPRPAFQVKPRHGATQRAVIEVLAASFPKPMSVKDIIAAVEPLLGVPISRGAVEGCLSAGAHSQRPRFVRVKPGWYRLA